MRPPGGFTVDMFNWANDFNFYREWANVVVHGRFEARIDRPYAVLYACRRDMYDYALDHADVLRRFAPLVLLETRMERVFAPAMGDHAYILRGPDLDELRAAARAIQAKAN